MLNLTNFQVEDCDLSDDTLRRYSTTTSIAVDTETMGLIPQRDRLCLIQLCDSDGFVTAIRIRIGQTEAPNLKQLMESRKVIKVFHYARFDVAQLLYSFKIHTKPIFCTKIASKLARTYTNSHGLKNLVQELEGIELDKSPQSSDWGNVSSLSEAQLNYAANDVLYLLSIQEKLTTMLKREERWQLAQNCFDCIPTFVDLDLGQYREIFEH
ncbi:ribonuclease H-like domain-containing protein [cyanobacterium endosymbiont of Epithemia turgida]|uniref:ribonuclease H-like domain-containing protein n=1 Tax=cyanobacterium endosymbiont of Epithemia turgida TaxID=718217 RepID=UPI0004D19239|nr:ribonuclease H-like domain-containing protein [cyanobacterium endosymbiont of Epithemia turgida]BAP17817.1 ribonuclease D [cyanobacterium endosymbiont of Epithemia turgida isolate EtSB Lake Yunoko]